MGISSWRLSGDRKHGDELFGDFDVDRDSNGDVPGERESEGRSQWERWAGFGNRDSLYGWNCDVRSRAAEDGEQGVGAEFEDVS